MMPVSNVNPKAKILLYSFALMIIILGIINLFQNRKVKELKNIRNQYETVTHHLEQLKTSYEMVSLKLDSARNKLTATTRDLETINGEIKTIFMHNITSLREIRTILGTAVKDLDTTVVEMDTTMVLLRVKR